jgi:hypothetical protein
MTFAADYSHIHQWVTNHGKATIEQFNDTTIVVSLSDAGGIPEDGKYYGSTTDEALGKANAALPSWLTETKKLLDSLLSGEIKYTECELICVAGWPAVKNPYYQL